MISKLGWRIRGLIVMEVAALTLSVVVVIVLTKLGLLQRELESLRPLIISLVVAVTLLIASAITSNAHEGLGQRRIVLDMT